MQAGHIPVLLNEVLTYLAPDGGVFVDGTFGAGGYTHAILEHHPDNQVIAFDRDPNTKPTADDFQTKFGKRFTFVQDCFSKMNQYLPKRVNGIVLDIGVSSMQIDQAERGFSLRFDGPLDMRMSQSGPTAADLIATLSETQLADILYKYGEERQSRKIAKILKKELPTTTKKLADLIHGVMPRPKDGSDSALWSFQALRIAVNDELGELECTLQQTPNLLAPNGRLVVVSFHSLEDRIVKDFLNQNTAKNVHKNKYADTKNNEGLFRILTKKPVIASPTELDKNPRAHSAKLRAAERTEVSQ